MAASSEGRCSCVQDSACLCSRTWVLVIHNDFEGIKEFKRQGDDVDVKNLRRVFETQRGCRFRELHNRGRKEIVQIFSQEELLIQLFQQPEGPLFCQPEAFILFILSHGESGGVILTDHFMENTDPDDLNFEKYNTKDVWNLAKMDFIASSLKLLFLGPCRGKLAEFRLIDEDKKNKFPTIPGWLSSKPNKENFVILYATVETTMANRCEADGTWFVEAICKELENLTVNLPLLDFLTRIQFQLCAKNTFGDATVGQTSQLHYFYHEKFTICASKTINAFNWTPTLEKREQTDNISLRNVASLSFHWSNETNDAKAGNLEGLVKSFEKRFTYDWLDKNGIQLKRGKALIFHDTSHYVCALKIGFALQGLGYATSVHDIHKLNSIITQICPKRNLKHDGSFVLCTLTKLRETENGLILKLAGQRFQLSQIIDEYTGTKCTQLIGKPKMFFFLDDRVMSDGEPSAEIDTNVISSGYKYFNQHAGVCSFVGVRSGPKGSGGDVVENLVQALGSPQLKEEGSNLQTVLSEVIAKAHGEGENTEDLNRIKPQFISTLPQLVNFPTLKSPYEQEKFSSNHYVFGSAFVTSIILSIMIIGLGYLLRTPKHLLVNVDGSCGVSFKGSDVLKNDAFSLSPSEWSNISKNCRGEWERTYSSDYAVIRFLNSSKQENAMKELEKSDNKRESVYRIVLFGYKSGDILKWIRWYAFLNIPLLQIDFLQTVVAKIASNHDYENIAVLELQRTISFKRIDQISHKLVQNWTKSVIDQTCDLVKNHYQNFKSIKNLNVDAQDHFVPLITFQCLLNASLGKFIDVLTAVKTVFPTIVCTLYQMLIVHMKKQNQLGSAKAFQLRLFSENSKSSLMKLEEKQKCISVDEILKLHFDEHARPYLQVYDNLSYANQCHNFPTVRNDYFESRTVFTSYLGLVVPYVVEMRYNGSLANVARIIKCMKDFKDDRVSLIGLQTLVKEFKMYNKPASFETLNLVSMFKFIWTDSRNQFFVGSINQQYKDKLFSVAPQWIYEYMFDLTVSCFYIPGGKCIESVIRDLGSIITDFESRNLTGRREILFVDFVLNSINKSAQMWRMVEPLAKRVEPFKKKMLSAMVRNFLGDNTTTDEDNAKLLYKYFGPRVWSAYLPLIVQEAYSEKGVQGMPLYLEKIMLLYERDSQFVCEGFFSLYSVMQQNITNLKTIEALFLMSYAHAVTKLTMYLASYDKRSSKEDCHRVMYGLNNYWQKGIKTYVSYFTNNTAKSLRKLKYWQKNYKYSFYFIVIQLINELRSKTKHFELPILHLIQNLTINKTSTHTETLANNEYLCPGINKLYFENSCDNTFADVYCTNFKNQMCYLVKPYNTPSTDNFFGFHDLCMEVNSNLCFV